jgi:CHASE3 domain sensor protein
METKFDFFIQGSASSPYRLELSIDPVTISCTCQAAIMGVPCKHRLSVLNGNTNEIIGLTPAIEEAVSIVSEIIKKSEIPDYMKEYEDAKNDTKAKNEKADKLFKKYREAIIANALKKGTEKQIKKASAELDAAIQDCVNAAAESESLIQALRTIFIRPDFA